MIVTGVAAGASKPNHGVASKPLNPDSSMVGNSGTAGERRNDERGDEKEPQEASPRSMHWAKRG